tara:strand:- start:432 stop:1034 length:603 start_codon:yes stop_codon:yes gene_type:complete
MLVLDLFCGTQSLKPIIQEKGWDYIGLDIEEIHKPDICIDFLDWDYKTIKPDIIWASPDCSCYSMANGGKHFDKDRNPKTEKAIMHLKILNKLKECINYHISENKKLIYFIENPTARMVWFINEYPRYDVSYCKYGCDRMKPTTIWSNVKGFIPKKCKNSNPDCHHIKAPRGSRKGTEAIPKHERYKVPYQLLSELFSLI